MSVKTEYKWLEPWPGLNYRQFFVKGRKLRAATLYRLTADSEPRTPEEVARDYDLPLEAALEAIDYSIRNEELLRQEREKEMGIIRQYQASGMITKGPNANHDLLY